MRASSGRRANSGSLELPLHATVPPENEVPMNSTASSNRVKVGIVGLGRWAKVLTRAAKTSNALEIMQGFSRSEESRAAFEKEFGVKSAPDLAALLGNPEIKGVILTVPNEQHLPRARGRQGRQARLHREADRLDLGGRPRHRGAGKDPWRQRHGRP